MIAPDAITARLVGRAYGCLGCAQAAEVSEPDALCIDCAPRYEAACEHLMRCGCPECVWAGAVDRARPDADDAGEVFA